jgi:hypothetical protein
MLQNCNELTAYLPSCHIDVTRPLLSYFHCRCNGGLCYAVLTSTLSYRNTATLNFMTADEEVDHALCTSQFTGCTVSRTG